MNPYLSFNSPPVSRSPGLSRPRLVKERKLLNSQNLKSSENSEFRTGLGFDTQSSLSGYGATGVSMSDDFSFGRSRNETFVFGASKVDLGGKLNSGKLNSNEDICRGVEEMRDSKSGSENELGSDYDGNVASELLKDMKELNIKDCREIESKFSSDANDENKFLFSGGENEGGSIEKSIGNGLPDGLKSTPKTEGNEDVGTEKFVLQESTPLRSGIHFQAGNIVDGISSTVTPEKNVEFSFSSKIAGEVTPVVEFKTPNKKGIPFSSLNQKLGFSAKSEALRDSKSKRKGKVKQPVRIQLNLGQDFVLRENNSCRNAETSQSSSAMDSLPHQGTERDKQYLEENAAVTDESFSLDNNSASTDSPPALSNNMVDDKLVTAPQNMDTSEIDVNLEATKEDDECHSDKGVESEDILEESASSSETESLKPAFVSSAETEVSSSLSTEKLDNSEITGSNFTFSASSAAAQGPLSASKYFNKKKNLNIVGYDSYNRNMKFPYIPSLSAQISPLSGVQSLLSAGKTHISNSSASSSKVENDSAVEKEHVLKHESNISSDTAQIVEQWRSRGNICYANGDPSKAEECYTQGINSISKVEISKSCLRTLMLSYSNRAAARMSLGRMREALGDCIVAASIDPNFLRVQVRAANCYLALGEVEDASWYFRKCLQPGNVACVDKKILIEASEGLQKAERVSETIHQCFTLLTRRTLSDVEKALELISQALSICPYSEKLLEMKAEALFTLRKYKEVIKLCEQTLDSAEKNCSSSDTNEQLANQDGTEFPKDSSFRIWRCCFIFKSYFHLGDIEESITSLEKQEVPFSVNKRDGGKSLESSIPLAATVRELLRLKNAGNEAFQSGRREEAVEYYTAALTCKVESRPFTAVCFCNRAAVYKALGQIIDSIADCSLAIALDGNYVKAISRRANLFEMIRDYWQAANDLRRLVALLTKQIEEKINQSGAYDGSSNLASDLRQARLHLSAIEEEARKGIPLDMYLILGVETSASASEIRKAYRKAALRHHPDKAGQFLSRNENGDDGLWKEIGEEVRKDADKLFKMIGEAYALLSDPAKRSKYDLEEETRNTQKIHDKSSTPKGYADAQNHPFERSGRRQQFTEAWRSYGTSASKGSEATRSNRYS